MEFPPPAVTDGSLTRIDSARAERAIVDALVRLHPMLFQDVLERTNRQVRVVPYGESLRVGPPSVATRMEMRAIETALPHLALDGGIGERSRPFVPPFDKVDFGYGPGETELNVLLWGAVERQLLQTLVEWFPDELRSVRETLRGMAAHFKGVAQVSDDEHAFFDWGTYEVAVRYADFLISLSPTEDESNADE
jgi:hypothetical protein